ncbi:Chorismate mutase I / Prephenate dehydratase [hydrothermal vent metagenome]|uniref:Bifunctional chorismate mutase/prephenate dehydratase n=1 Tax=hydrothermal vent metagenome TaxID=652676 RepID=A0A3B1ALT6_9ZZZZ
MPDTLSKMRARIDDIDASVQELISERAVIAQNVAHAKQKSNDTNTVYYRAEREAQVLRMVIERNKGPLQNEEMARLFREIMSACLALEDPMVIGFLGPEGTFTQSAALKHFGHSVQTKPLTTIADVFREVESGEVPYGVVPIENSTEGVVNHTLDLFINSPLFISGEVEIRIHHHLLINEKTDISCLTKIYSHQQSLAQCREWLDANLTGVELIPVTSNAEAAKIVSNSDEAVAAIAGDSAAEIYKLALVCKNIEDEPSNTTRFLIIGKSETQASGDDKTTILVSTRNQSGALHKLLEPLASNGLSLSRIESRPSRQGMWEYVFFIDVDGHKSDADVAAALHDLINESQMVKVLGSYPKAVL